MCNFFSCVSNGRGKLFYFDAQQRAALRRDNPRNYNPDSHTSIADFYGYTGAREDSLNKYEYNPITQQFRVDQINTKDDSVSVEKKLLNLDFKTIVPELVVKPIVNPLLVERTTAGATDHELELLRQWNSVFDRVWDSSWDSVFDSVFDSVWNNVRNNVRNNVLDNVLDNVCKSVGGRHVWGRLFDSVWDSARAYVSSFFVLPKWRYIDHVPGENPFQPAADLWEAGLVPSFDGTTWRLHAGPKANIVWKGKI